MTDVDIYHCPECGYEWGGHGRPPPYAHCPECNDAMMRRGPSTKEQKFPVNNPESDHDLDSTDPSFWRGYRVTRVGGTIYLENEAGVEAFTPAMAEAYALAIIAELYGGRDDA